MVEQKERKRLAKCKTDKERWEFFLGYNGKDLTVWLDNDSTSVSSEYDVDFFVTFDEYIGNSLGVISLLQAMEIKVKRY